MKREWWDTVNLDPKVIAERSSEMPNLRYRVEPSSANQPYKFAVLDRGNRAVAFAVTKENAQHWCDQLNGRGYIENPD